MWPWQVTWRSIATSGAATAAWTREQLGQVAAWARAFTRERIPRDRLAVSFNRSRGPGGQNVNKVNTKAEVRFELAAADWLPAYTRGRLRELEGHRINKEGQLIVTSERNRTQSANLDDCFGKLHEMIQRASEVPKEPDAAQRAHVRGLEHAAKQRRMLDKKRQSSLKRSRQWRDD